MQVLHECDERTKRNELAVDIMNRRLNEEEKKKREREIYWEVSREEHERAHREHEQEMRELRRLLHDHSVRFDADFKRSSERFEEDLRRSREADEQRHKRFEEDLRRSREADEQRHKEFEEDMRRSREEFDERIKVLDGRITKLSTHFIGTVGHIVEGLAGSKVEDLFTAEGYDVSDKRRNVHRKVKILNTEMEADVVLLGEHQAIVIEVKSSCGRGDIDKFVSRMKERFRTLFPEWRHLEVFGAIAAINYEKDADAYAGENGLFVIRVDSSNVFTLDKPDRDSLQRF